MTVNDEGERAPQLIPDASAAASQAATIVAVFGKVCKIRGIKS